MTVLRPLSEHLSRPPPRFYRRRHVPGRLSVLLWSPRGNAGRSGRGFEPTPSRLAFERNAVEVLYDCGTPPAVAAAAGFANWSHLARSPLPRARVRENSCCHVCSDLPRRKVSVRPGKRATEKGLAFNRVSASEVRSGGGRSSVGDEGRARVYPRPTRVPAQPAEIPFSILVYPLTTTVVILHIFWREAEGAHTGQRV